MPKGLLIKGPNKTALIPYRDEYADDPRFEVIPDVAAYLASLKEPKPKRQTKKKTAARRFKPTTPPPSAPSDELDDLLMGLDTGGEEDDR